MISDLERAINKGIVPWKELEFRTLNYWVFKDGYPVTEGHLLFVPTNEIQESIFQCFQAAYEYGIQGIFEGKWEGFNIGQNVGEVAGQTIKYPHVHLIPRRSGDMQDPSGGVRHVIPEKGNYRKCK